MSYQNLKRDWTINTVREEDVKRLWLPLLVYTNTDQQETTRLGEIWEWSTILHILREGQYSRNSLKMHTIKWGWAYLRKKNYRKYAPSQKFSHKT